MGLPEVLASVVSGGVTGLLGAVITSVAEYKTKKLDIEASEKKFAHEVAMKKADAEIMAQEWATRTRVAEIESESREAVADAESFAASFREPSRYTEGLKLNRKQGWVMVSLDFIRGIVRPGLTLYLCAITTLIYVEAQGLIGVGITGDQAYSLVSDIVNTVLYLTTTCVLWYFGARNKAKPPRSFSE